MQKINMWRMFGMKSWAVVAALGLFGALLAISLGSRAVAQDHGRSLTRDDVVLAFRDAGLSVDDLHRQPVGSSPSGPPATEREAYGFSVPGLAPSGGRILIFDDAEKLGRKAAWFRRSGGTAFAHHNVLLWLDPAMPKRDAARYHQALQGVK